MLGVTGGTGSGVWKTKLAIKKSKLFYMYAALFFVGGRGPQKLIWIDSQGSVTHMVEIFKFGDVSGPRAKKWPKVNLGLKIVNYFTCIWHFSCRWYRPPEVDLNGYPRISNSYCHDIQIGDVSGPRAKKWPKVNRRLKEVKEALVATHHTFTTTYFLQYVGQYVGPIFSWEKINEYFWYHSEIFLGVFYDNLC